MQIMPDPVMVLLQLLPFGLTLIALKFIIFDPMLEYLEERTAATAGGRQAIAQLEAQIAERMATYETQLAAARSEIVELRAERRAAATAEYDAIVSAARKEADDQVSTAIGDIQREAQVARANLEQDAKNLAQQIAGQVLGRDLAAG